MSTPPGDVPCGPVATRPAAQPCRPALPAAKPSCTAPPLPSGPPRSGARSVGGENAERRTRVKGKALRTLPAPCPLQAASQGQASSRESRWERPPCLPRPLLSRRPRLPQRCRLEAMPARLSTNTPTPHSFKPHHPERAPPARLSRRPHPHHPATVLSPTCETVTQSGRPEVSKRWAWAGSSSTS